MWHMFGYFLNAFWCYILTYFHTLNALCCTTFSFLDQSIVGIIAGWLWRCLACPWIRSCSSPIVSSALTFPTTPAGTTAAPCCRSSTRCLPSPRHRAASPLTPPLHLPPKPTPIASVKSSYSKVSVTTTQQRHQTWAVWGFTITVDSSTLYVRSDV